VYVLDRHLQPLPLGVPGELCIAGDGLARGYVDRPQLTVERFVEARLAPGLDERLYRTGDLVRWLPDGTLEFLGRLDEQVKVRGHRVELGDIEAALKRHPRIREAAVVARSGAGGEPRLVAYVVRDGALEARDLRAFVARALPEYMIPAAFVTLERLPLAANGKVDRAALPQPLSGPPSPATVVEPRDDLERRLVKIWQNVLGVAPIGIRDHFFELGGHSLLAVRLFAQLQSELRVDLPLATLFEAPTIEGLATFVRDLARTPVGHSLVAIQPLGHRPAIFGLPGVDGGVLGFHTLARLLGSDQPFYGLQTAGRSSVSRTSPPRACARSASGSRVAPTISSACAWAAWWPGRSRSSSARPGRRWDCSRCSRRGRRRPPRRRTRRGPRCAPPCCSNSSARACDPIGRRWASFAAARGCGMRWGG
jgi:acyl carrier protein